MKLCLAVFLALTTFAFAGATPQCKKPVNPPVNKTVTTNNTSTSAASSNQSQQQSTSSTATGGDATAQGGQGGNSTSNTKVAASAISPPIMPTVPCFKGAGAAVQVGMIGASGGGGKVDQGCDDRELARSFSGPQTVASCKILISTKKAKKAGITLEDCLPPSPEPAAPTPVAPTIVIEQAPVVPAPNVTLYQDLTVPPTVTKEAVQARVAARKTAAKKKVQLPACVMPAGKQ